MSNLNLDSILEELSNMKFDNGNKNESSRPSYSRSSSRKASDGFSRKQSRITTNFNNLLNELQETQNILEKDNNNSSNSSFDNEPSLSPKDKTGRKRYSTESNNSKHDSRSRSRSRSLSRSLSRSRSSSRSRNRNRSSSRNRSQSRTRDKNNSNSNSETQSPVEKKKFPSRISSMKPSNKINLQNSQYNRSRGNSKSSIKAPSLKIPESPSPLKENYEFDDDEHNVSLPSSYRDDYEYMMSNYEKPKSPKSKTHYDNLSPKIKTRNTEKTSPYLRNQKISSKPSSKYTSPVTSPDPYSKSYNSYNEPTSPYIDKKSKKKSSSKNRYSDDESDDEILGYKNSRKTRKNKYDDDDDVFLYENDADDRYSRNKASPIHNHSNRAYNEEDFDEDESDITISESSDSFMSSEESFGVRSRSRSHESETDDDDIPLQAAKSKSSGIRGRNRHLKKFNTVASEEKSPVRASRSTKRSTKKEKKKRTPSQSSRHNNIVASASMRSPKENYYEETAKENFMARTKKEFTTDYAEASLKKITTRIYIGDASVYESIMLTSAMPAREVIGDIIRKRNIPDTPDWTLFELCNDFGVERPLKEWEIVTDVITSWDIQKTKNALIMKKYNYFESLKASSAVGRFPSIRGKLYMETKPGKFNKRQFELRPNGLYYYKKKSSQETLLVNLNSYDVYTLLVHMPNAPTEFAFAIKSTDPIHFFEDKKKYIYYLYAEDINSLFDWVMSIRQGKTEKYVLEQHEKDNNAARSPTGLMQKQQIYRTQPTLLEEKQRIKSLEAQKSRKYQKEANGPLVQIDQIKTKPASRSKSMSGRKSSGPSRNGPLISLDKSSSRKSAQNSVQTPQSSSSRRGPKPLVDISDAKNCYYCGCSENKYDPWKQNICANCHHDHRAYQ